LHLSLLYPENYRKMPLPIYNKYELRSKEPRLPPNCSTFLKVTTFEKKTGFLLIEVFSKLFNTQNYGHQGSILGGLLLFIRGSKNFAFLSISHPPNNARGQIVTILS